MSTRSLIARRTKDGIETIYCHFDGYPEHHGPILKEHYAREAEVEALLNMGDLAVLAPHLGEKHDFATHPTTEKAVEWCLAYGRDRGEKDTAKRVYATEGELMAEAEKGWAAYIYLFDEGRWLYRKMGEGNVWRTDL